MEFSESGEFTQVLQRHQAGAPEAEQHLLAMVYHDLRRLARRHLNGHARSATLDTTALIHESYLRLVAPAAREVQSRAHFMNLASRIMRQVVIDYARKRLLERRHVEHADAEPEALESRIAADRQAREFVALDEALVDLERVNARQVRVIECRFFAGLSEEETAAALDTSVRTVQRDWAQARDWLANHMHEH